MLARDGADMDLDTFFSKLVTHLQQLRPGRDCSGLTPTTHLFERGYLDSFLMVQLIVFLEDLVGREIRLSADELPNFFTAASIHAAYVAPRGEP
jgi:acyl carrier protein